MENFTKLEKNLENKCVAYIEKKFPEAFFLKLDAHLFKGIPDRIFLGEKKTVFFIEFKSENSYCTKRQRYIHSLLNLLGFNVYIIKTFAEFKLVIQQELCI
jgi:hypothetical protein